MNETELLILGLCVAIPMLSVVARMLDIPYPIVLVPWAVAFALGAIVSPTDPVAATAIARELGAPRRLVNMIEGESLLNDSSALIAYRVALAAAIGGSFSLFDASVDFVVAVLGGIAVGLVVGAAI